MAVSVDRPRAGGIERRCGARGAARQPCRGHARLQNGTKGARLAPDLQDIEFATFYNGDELVITPRLTPGFPSTTDPDQEASIVVTLELFCDGPTSTDLSFFVQAPHKGASDLLVHHNRFVYRATAFNGLVHEGKIAIRMRFAKGGKVVNGTVRVHGSKLTDPSDGDVLTNCDTDPGGKPADRGRPLSFHLVGAA